MHPATLILAMTALLGAAGTVQAETRIDCKPADSGPCAPPPVPPMPPVPPAPPAPPAPPSLPAIAPPALPALPDVPEKAHAACAGKADGSSVSVTLGPGETMRGLCERVGGAMVFQLRSYRRG